MRLQERMPAACWRVAPEGLQAALLPCGESLVCHLIAYPDSVTCLMGLQILGQHVDKTLEQQTVEIVLSYNCRYGGLI